MLCCAVAVLSGIINRGTDMETGEANVKLFTKYNLLKLWTVCVMFFVNLLNYMDRYTIAGKEGMISGLQLYFTINYPPFNGRL